MFHPKVPPKVYSVPIGCIIVDVPIMILGLIRNTNSKLMVVEVFPLFVATASAHNGGR